MKLNKTEPIAGLDARLVRDGLRRIHGRSWLEEGIDYAMGQPEGAGIADRLVREGLLTDSVQGRERTFTTTLLGGAVANARFTPPVSRAVAGRHLAAFLKRVEEVNASERFLCTVERVVLFGSFLDETREQLGDVDLALRLVPRPMSPQERLGRSTESYNNRYRGRSPTILERAAWPWQEVLLYLNGGSRVLRLTSDDDGVFAQEGINWQQIYPPEPPATP